MRRDDRAHGLYVHLPHSGGQVGQGASEMKINRAKGRPSIPPPLPHPTSIQRPSPRKGGSDFQAAGLFPPFIPPSLKRRSDRAGRSQPIGRGCGCVGAVAPSGSVHTEKEKRASKHPPSSSAFNLPAFTSPQSTDAHWDVRPLYKTPPHPHPHHPIFPPAFLLFFPFCANL